MIILLCPGRAAAHRGSARPREATVSSIGGPSATKIL